MTTVFQITRDKMDSGPTTGQLLAPPDLSLYTLEDPWLDNQPDISCIPVGTYRCIKSWSLRWKKQMPELLMVPFRSAIRIHGGNTTADTHGCILVGMSLIGMADTHAVGVGPITLTHSQQALGYFTDWLETALLTDQVLCEVSCANPQ